MFANSWLVLKRLIFLMIFQNQKFRNKLYFVETSISISLALSLVRLTVFSFTYALAFALDWIGVCVSVLSFKIMIVIMQYVNFARLDITRTCI